MNPASAPSSEPVTDDPPPGRRRLPAQGRAHKTVDAICTAASLLIEEEGIVALTTNKVAQRAGVSITAVYAYFDDKWAIVHELFVRFERLRAEALEGIFADFETAADWRPSIDAIWDAMARFREEVPGAAAIRMALYGSPRLARLDYEGTVRTATGFAASMRRRRPELSEADAYRAAWTVSVAAGVLIDDAVREGTVDWATLDEGKTMIKRHLAAYLDEVG